jgi:small subunit ribosomal protein S20
MANHESAKKACRQSDKKRMINKNRKSKMKTLAKNVLSDINSLNLESAKQNFILFQSSIMKACSKKILKLNTASRKVSAISNLIKQASLKG